MSSTTGHYRPVPTARSPSLLRVALRSGETGVTVSVTGRADEADDDAALRRAVTRLLARHGLVLVELRVTRRFDGGPRDQEKR